VRQGLLDAQGEQHDAGDHRQVQVGEGVARDLVALLSGGRVDQSPRGHKRDDVEVQPPQAGDQDDADDGGGRDAGVDDVLGPGADRDDGLAQRNEHDQAVALGEVVGDQAPALAVDEERAAHVECQRQHPQHALQRAVGEGGRADQGAADAGADGEAEHGVA
jgi:hypothetical protein